MVAARSDPHPRIVCDPRILGGVPVVRGTRLPVWTIAFLWKAAGDADLILREYPQIERSDVEAALAYYRTHEDEIEAAIRDNQADGT